MVFKKRPKSSLMQALCVAGGVCVVVFGFGSPAWAQLALITDQEAQAPNAVVAHTRAITRGPGVKVKTPTQVQAAQFPLRIELEARGGSKLDAQSLRVEYLKQPVIDLTPRIKSAFNGQQLDLPQVRVPAGHHLLRVSIRDVDGREGSHTFELIAK
jgi:hypothetical protein